MADIYQIRLKGHLDHDWSDWLDGLTITHHADGTTCLVGPVADQAALHGLLNKIRDLGLPLLSLIRVEPDEQEPINSKGEFCDDTQCNLEV